MSRTWYKCSHCGKPAKQSGRSSVADIHIDGYTECEPTWAAPDIHSEPVDIDAYLAQQRGLAFWA